MLPIEAEYFVALEKLKRQTSADPTIDINEVKRSYQGLRDDLGNSCSGCEVFILMVYVMVDVFRCQAWP